MYSEKNTLSANPDNMYSFMTSPQRFRNSEGTKTVY